jgi:hypothetical protein
MVEPKRIDDHFSVIVSTGRPISPITKGNWEGTGIEPDVKVAAAEALDVAQKLAAKEISKNSSNPVAAASFNSSQRSSFVSQFVLQNQAVAFDADNPVPDRTHRGSQLENESLSLDSAGMIFGIKVEPDFVVRDRKISRRIFLIGPPSSLQLLDIE